MLATTQDYNDKIRTPIQRKVYGKVQIDYTDPFLDQSITVTTTEAANVSFPSQVADGVAEPAFKYASLDGSWVLGADYTLAPEPGDTRYQMGWWGSKLAGVGDAFTAPYPTLTINFLPRPITKLQAVGDSKRQEYPVDFDINLYDKDNNLLYTETMTSNTLIAWSVALDSPVTQVAVMELVIKKWSHAGRQVKIMEFFTSIQETYEGDDIFSISFLEEKEVSSGSLPIGNISSNEINLKLYNDQRKFDAGNIQSSLYGLVKTNRRIKAWIGTETELMPLGTFWSGDWNVPSDDVYAQTVGRDRLDLLRQSTYSTSEVQIDQTLYDLAESVLADGGLEVGDYWIDDELKDYTVPYSYFGEQSHREALRKIAEACLGQAYCDRDGVLRIEGFAFTDNKVTEVAEKYFPSPNFTIEDKGIEAYGIGPDDYFTKNNPARGEEVANYIEVETMPLKPDAIQEVYSSNEPYNVTASEQRSITVFYNESPCINATASLENEPAGCIIDQVTYYAWGANVKVSSPLSGTFTLVINAQPMKILNKEKAVKQDVDSITENGLLKYTFPGNPLVQTLAIAQSIADKLLQYYKDPRRDVEIEWRGNPALELGDLITVSDYQRDGIDQRGFYYITKQEIQFDGTLRARLSGRRAL